MIRESSFYKMGEGRCHKVIMNLEFRYMLPVIHFVKD
jgi:hypothetical protein